MHRDNWDDLRFVLAVADAGSVSAAARRLGVNHATVLRRVAGFEDRLNTSLFDRDAKGYRVPPNRMKVVTALREVQDSILAVERALKGATEPLRGELNVTSTDTFCQKLLPEIIAGFCHQAPDLRVNLVCTNAHVDFDRLSADLTVRPAGQLADGLFGDIACNLGFGVFKRKGQKTQRWHELQGALAGSLPAKWMRETLSADHIIQGADSFLVLQEMAVFGAGMSILPHFIGREDPRLIEVHDIMPDTNVDIWVASHSDLRNSPRIRAGQAMLLAGLKQHAARLGGS